MWHSFLDLIIPTINPLKALYKGFIINQLDNLLKAYRTKSFDIHTDINSLFPQMLELFHIAGPSTARFNYKIKPSKL
jgi:hypothetical protein